MNAPRHRRPHLRVTLGECFDLVLRQLETLVPQLRERLEWPLSETGTQIFIGEQAAHQQLNRFLRHVSLNPALLSAPSPTCSFSAPGSRPRLAPAMCTPAAEADATPGNPFVSKIVESHARSRRVSVPRANAQSVYCCADAARRFPWSSHSCNPR